MSSASERTSDKTIEDSGQFGLEVSGSETNWLARMLSWSLLVGLWSAVITFVIPSNPTAPNSASDALSDSVSILVGFSVACYTWYRFSSCKHGVWLASALAFSTFTLFVSLHAFLHITGGGRAELLLASVWCEAFSRIAAAGLLMIAATTKKVFHGNWTWKTYANTFAAWAIISALTTFGIIEVASHSLSWLATNGKAIATLVVSGPYMIAAFLCLLATSAFARRGTVSSDRLTKVVCLWLLPMALGCGVRAVSINPSPNLWWQAHLLDMVAALVIATGINIDSAQADAKSTERFTALEAMHQISWSLAGAASLPGMMSAFVEVLARTTGARLVALYLLDDSAAVLRLEAVFGDDYGYLNVGAEYSLEPQPRPGFHNGHTARALKERRTQVVQDVNGDVEFLPWQCVALRNGWVVSVPLQRREGPIGTLNLYLEQEKTVIPERLHLLETMAALVTPAIESRRNTLEIIDTAKKTTWKEHNPPESQSLPKAA
ncbi:MAG: GAF domain-containing protein [Armatimonadota bacterium]|nr:GAF domain-containing protein [Armatimonadota bacterium]